MLSQLAQQQVKGNEICKYNSETGTLKSRLNKLLELLLRKRYEKRLLELIQHHFWQN
jgi:hypothetical protein